MTFSLTCLDCGCEYSSDFALCPRCRGLNVSYASDDAKAEMVRRMGSQPVQRARSRRFVGARMTPTTTRAQHAAEAQRLRDQGLLVREIAKRMGVPKESTVGNWLSDPDGSKSRERKERYREPCERCGVLMNGSDGRGPNRPKHCQYCNLVDSTVRMGALARHRVLVAQKRWAKIAEMWNAGAGGEQIAAALGTTSGCVWSTLHRMRAQGWDVPPRRARR